MAKITNNTERTIKLPTNHVIGPKATLDTTNDVLRMTENAAMLGGLARSLQVTLDYDPEALPDQAPVKESIEPNPAAVEQAAVDLALAKAKEKEAADQLTLIPAEEQSTSKPAGKK